MLGINRPFCIAVLQKLNQQCLPSSKNILLQSRTMARGRNYYLKKGSKPTNISPETRELIKNARHSENVDEWQREPGIGDPYKFSQYRENPEDIDDETHLDMIYYPHKGEEPWPENFQPSPVFLVERVKTLKGEPWWHKMDCERIGLGVWARSSKKVALPNLSFYNALLYRIKHLVEITPVEFPDGIPSPEEFDPKNAKVTHDGKFIYHAKIGEYSQVMNQSKDNMKIKEDTHRAEAQKCWTRPYNGSPYGTSNYHRDYSKMCPEKTDYITDDTNRIKF